MTLVEPDTLEQEIDAWLLANYDELALATDSRSLPDLPNKKNKTNWVERAGGLPSYIDRIAKHLHSEKGKSVSQAIAIAVNTVKRWCSSGEVTEGGSGGVSAKTKALACKAVAQWEAKKAKSKTDASATGAKERLVTLDGVFVYQSDHDLILSVARAGLESDWATFDSGAYTLALSQARIGRLNLAVFDFDPAKHPRDAKGQWRKIIGGLKSGETAKLPDGTSVTKTDATTEHKTGSKYDVRSGDGKTQRFHKGSADEAADDADSLSSTKLEGDSSAGKADDSGAVEQVKALTGSPQDPRVRVGHAHVWKKPDAAGEPGYYVHDGHKFAEDAKTPEEAVQKARQMSDAIDATPEAGASVFDGKNPRKQLSQRLSDMKDGEALRFSDGTRVTRGTGPMGNSVWTTREPGGGPDTVHNAFSADEAADRAIIHAAHAEGTKVPAFQHEGRLHYNGGSKTDMGKAARAFIKARNEQGGSKSGDGDGPDAETPADKRSETPGAGGAGGDKGGSGEGAKPKGEEHGDEIDAYFDDRIHGGEEYGPDDATEYGDTHQDKALGVMIDTGAPTEELSDLGVTNADWDADGNIKVDFDDGSSHIYKPPKQDKQTEGSGDFKKGDKVSFEAGGAHSTGEIAEIQGNQVTLRNVDGVRSEAVTTLDKLKKAGDEESGSQGGDPRKILGDTFARVNIDSADENGVDFSLPGGDDENNDYSITRAGDKPWVIPGQPADDKWVLTELPLDAYDDQTDEYDPEQLTHHVLQGKTLDEAIKNAGEILKDRASE